MKVTLDTLYINQERNIGGYYSTVGEIIKSIGVKLNINNLTVKPSKMLMLLLTLEAAKYTKLTTLKLYSIKEYLGTIHNSKLKSRASTAINKLGKEQLILSVGLDGLLDNFQSLAHLKFSIEVRIPIWDLNLYEELLTIPNVKNVIFQPNDMLVSELIEEREAQLRKYLRFIMYEAPPINSLNSCVLNCMKDQNNDMCPACTAGIESLALWGHGEVSSCPYFKKLGQLNKQTRRENTILNSFSRVGSFQSWKHCPIKESYQRARIEWQEV